MAEINNTDQRSDSKNGRRGFLKTGATIGAELKQLTEYLSKIKIVGDRYTGAQAEQTKK